MVLMDQHQLHKLETNKCLDRQQRLGFQEQLDFFQGQAQEDYLKDYFQQEFQLEFVHYRLVQMQMVLH